ncbi:MULTISPECIES: type IV pilin protein [unclassified Herbaspirillum]|uniref:type IV pilin protein n=1 Tax=unclassified Herbaspirillum TaxID=2624150 RepID=UPI001154F813|nr:MULTISPECIES: type IV pilin protein [unclassified Herbaspirillum]MBB5391485.1 type IV pilus assembly protein PilE [Herbaspirillum sp. SJZ102]TQK12831.1 type IV pilus assembly protein PilE [Herbaspirillum sp. SJZ130]TQK14835.1 type IV pilus assembly protein PilE [Herbaspirillum sp. SJZ106]TWC71086.1 type IV pilus assembly protein PilE [Herbaspirillum sp. SJZ099]
MTTSRTQHGFTLIELTMAIAIVGILATLAWSGYSQHLLKTRRAEGRAAVLQVLLQQERQFSYRHSYRAFVPGAQETEFKWHSGERPETSAYSISAQACDGEDLHSCVRVTATPGGALVDSAYRDERCGALYADSRGRRGADGNDCW